MQEAHGPDTCYGMVHLQYVGDCPGTPVRNLNVGDVLMWNAGLTSEVIALERLGHGSWRITERDRHSDYVASRVKRGGTLVVRVQTAKPA